MSGVGVEISRFIKQNFPVVRRRSALWFFTNEMRSAQTCSASSGQSTTKKISRNKILILWRNMDLESKRKYFNMAEFDDIRYREQKSSWVSEVGALLMKHKGSLPEVSEGAPTHEQLQAEFLESLEKIHKSYERMIQAESTKTLYKDAIRHSESQPKAAELISAVPKQHRSILAQPRRPPVAFVLYLSDNMARYKEMRSTQGVEDSCMRLAGREWAKLDVNTRAAYEERYNKLRDEYNKAKAEYRSKIESDDSGQLVDQAHKEKKAFKKSLRKRLKDASVLPVSIRNAFNFFLMDNKNVKLTDLTEIWRNLPEDQKIKYIKMSHEDVIRYQNEIEAYREIKKALSELIVRTKSCKN